MLRNFQEFLEPFFCESGTNPAKFPPNFPQNFRAKNLKEFTHELLQERREKFTLANADGENGQPRSRLSDIIWKQANHPPSPSPRLANFYPKPLLRDYLVRKKSHPQ